MPKGDREILKADIEDGYGKVANLLLESLAMSSLNGKQMSICMFIIRRTYSWGRKSDQITLKDFAKACNSSESYMSKQLKKLIKWNVIKRENYSPGKAPDYEINTRVDEWDKGCMNVQGLYESTRQGLYICTRQGLNKRTRVEQGQSIENTSLEVPPKESIKESIKESTTTTIKGKQPEDIQDKNSVAQIGAAPIKQNDSLSSIESKYLELTNRCTCSSKDHQAMIAAYKKYRDIDFIIKTIEKAVEANVQREGRLTINSFNYFKSILEEEWERKNVSSIESKIPYDDIIDYLNSRANKDFKVTVDIKRLINARYEEGFKIDDFMKVIDKKTRKWKETKMDDYLRPQTLFSNKFQAYLNESEDIPRDKVTEFKPRKTSFHNFESRTSKYTAEELENMVRYRPERKQGG